VRLPVRMILLAPPGFEPESTGPKPATLGHCATGLLFSFFSVNAFLRRLCLLGPQKALLSVGSFFRQRGKMVCVRRGHSKLPSSFDAPESLRDSERRTRGFESRQSLRSPGFEPGFVAWKATVLPLDYERVLCVLCCFFCPGFEPGSLKTAVAVLARQRPWASGRCGLEGYSPTTRLRTLLVFDGFYE
jgi:hypothetical protein